MTQDADRTADAKGSSSEDEQEDVDLKAEKQKRLAETREANDNLRLPPRPNRSGPMPKGGPPSSMSLQTNRGSSLASRLNNGSTTPPRRPGDAGVQVDNNFAEENWDDEDDKDADDKGDHGPMMTGAKSAAPQTGSQADPNWLQENFDED